MTHKILPRSAAVLAIVLASGAAHAQSATGQATAETQGSVSGQLGGNSEVVAQNRTYIDVLAALEEQGYSVDNVRTTLLGRVRIEARNEVHVREVVVSRNTGEILSDIVLEVFTQGEGEAGTGTTPAATDDSDGDASVGLNADVNIDAGGSLSVGNDGGGVSVGGSSKSSGGVSLGLGN